MTNEEDTSQNKEIIEEVLEEFLKTRARQIREGISYVNYYSKENVEKAMKKILTLQRKNICKEIEKLIETGKKCPDCKREEYKCIEAHDLLKLLKKFQGEEK